MKTSMPIKSGAIAALLLLSFCATEAATVETVSEAKPGVWMESFAAATNLAIQTKTPMVFVWGNNRCSYCDDLADAVNSQEFVRWQAEHSGYVYCYVKGVGGKDVAPNKDSGAKEFAWTAGGTKPKLDSYPFICLYWPKADGTVVADGFVGRPGEISGKSNGRSLAKQFTDAVDELFADFSAEKPVPRFVCSDTAWDRLEALESTGYVDVPLVRESGAEDSGTLVASWPGGIAAEKRYPVSWNVGATSVSVRISLDRGTAVFPVGEKMSLSLLDSDGTQIASGSVNFVEDGGNSVVNPKFVGESFAHGEWTMDYEAARKKDGYVLAVFSGTLWCPYCYGLENSLLADPRFTAWAKEKRVSLVLFDQGRASSPATAAGNGQARLLTYDAGRTSLAGRATASGAAYLSRKMISREAAQRCIDDVTRKTSAWLSPGSTAARLGNPTVLLVKNDKVVGRLSPFRDDSKSYDTDENLGRLNDLLSLAEREDESSDYAETTSRRLSSMRVETAWFQVNDRTEYFRLADTGPGVWRFDARNAPEDAGLTLSVLSEKDVLASGSGSVSVNLTEKELSGNLFLGVTAYASSAERIFVDGVRTTAFAAEISAENLPDPGEVAFIGSGCTIRECETNIEIRVARTGGTYGAAFVNVVSDGSGSSSGCYDWTDQTLIWADGEGGEKTAVLGIRENSVYDGSRTMVFSLVPQSGTLASVSSSEFAVSVYDSDKPGFESSDLAFNAWKSFGFEAGLPLVNLKSGKVTIKKISGSLPSGMKIRYDSGSGSVVLCGTPRKTGRYSAVYRVSQRVSGKAVTGERTCITVTVGDPEDLNPYLGEKRAKRDIPLVSGASCASRRVLAGKLTLSVSSSGRISAKYAVVGSGSRSFSGTWQNVDANTGDVTARLLKKDDVLTLRMSYSGDISACVELAGDNDILDACDGALLLAGEAYAVETGVFDSLSGCYTVQLPMTGSADGINFGDASLSLRMTSSSDVKNGKMRYSGVFPDGKPFSGSSHLIRNRIAGSGWSEQNGFLLPVLVTSSSRTFGALLKILPNARRTWDTPSDAEGLAVVSAADDTLAYGIMNKGDSPSFFDVHGGYYRYGVSPEEICSLFALNNSFRAYAGAEGVVSERYGEARTWPEAVMVADGKKFRISSSAGKMKFSTVQKTGMVKGSGVVDFEGKRISGRFSGAVLPGWVDCQCGEGFVERPFASGSFWFKDYVRIGNRWKSLIRSVPMSIEISE